MTCLQPFLRLRLDRLQNLYEFHALIEHLVCTFKFGQDINQVAEPEDSLFCFLERNADFMDEIGYGFGAVRLMIVRADRCRGLADLEAEILKFVAMDVLNQPMDIRGKPDRPRLKFGAELLSAEFLLFVHGCIISNDETIRSTTEDSFVNL